MGDRGTRTLSDLLAEARDTLVAAGVEVDHIELNGSRKWQRPKGREHLWYVADHGTSPSGRPWLMVTAGNLKETGDPHQSTVVYKSWETDHYPLPQADREAIQRELKQAEQQRQHDEAAQRAAAREQAGALWSTATDEVNGHPYLTAKGVSAHGIRVAGDALLIPVRDTAGELHGLQRIFPDGSKRFTPGTAVSGHYHLIGTPTDLVCVAEGYASASTVCEATGEAVAASFNCGNLRPVAEALRAAHPDISIVVCGDDDHATEGNPGRHHAELAAKAVGARVVFPVFSDQSKRGSDFNDLASAEGIEAVQRQLADAITSEGPVPLPKAPDQDVDEDVIGGAPLLPDATDPRDDVTGDDLTAEIKRLAALSLLEYDRAREGAAKALKVRVGTLDKEVYQARGGEDDDDYDAVVEELELWPEPVGGPVLDEIRDDFEHYIVADAVTKDALSLWALGTFCYDAFPIFPKALVGSAEKRCGKTVTLEVIEANCHRPLMASSITASAVFRAVQEWRPTLIVDEADRLPKDNEELIGIINAGHRKRSAFVIRNVKVGDDHMPRKFSVWSPMALGAIGRLAGTIMDRSIVVDLRRKAPGETVVKVPLDLFERNRNRRRRCLRWARDSDAQLRTQAVQMPSHSNDRMRDNWLPLFTIAAVVGGDWPTRVGAAFSVLSREEDDEAIGPMLLADIREIFETRRVDRRFSQDLVDDLVALEGRPWAEWRRGKPITQNGVARLLTPYRIRPESIRIGPEHRKGYKHTAFRDAWRRYLSDAPPSEVPLSTVTPGHPSNDAASSEKQTGTRPQNVPVQNRHEPSNDAGCPGVPAENRDNDERRYREVF